MIQRRSVPSAILILTAASAALGACQPSYPPRYLPPGPPWSAPPSPPPAPLPPPPRPGL